MSPFSPLSLDRFNQQVLACQEETFTLAFSLLGDEALACEVLQEIILRVYSGWRDDDSNIVVKVLHGVIGMCRQSKPSKAYTGVELIPGWNQLERSEQEALLLIDLLGKSYPETALVLNCSEHDLGVTVADGRCKLTRSFKPEKEPGRV
jgi:DNA-directed RNA polymerase specialized sigma24 family protein